MSEYQPGVCNIGKAEKRKRYGLGLGSMAVFIALGATILAGLVSPIGLIFAFIAAMTGFEGILQGYLSFCAGFASQGIYDVSEKGDERHDVEDDTARKQDRLKALQIHLYSFTGALSFTALLFVGMTLL
ncbi:MAG: hypothetical protein ABEJ87_03835 [Candidatus Nanohalobium sp.]